MIINVKPLCEIKEAAPDIVGMYQALKRPRYIVKCVAIVLKASIE
jgi:hypothetical protein